MGLPHLISIVGAGPGDPELLTVKAVRRLQNADVVLYDALLGEAMLALAKKDAQLIYVGKLWRDEQCQTKRQNEIHGFMERFAVEGKQVVRLKAGDAMVFGRGAEEIRFCKSRKLNYEVIPGVTAGLAAASVFDIPLTERGKSAMTLLYSGHRKGGELSDVSTISSVLKTGSPVVIYMGLNSLLQLSGKLMEDGVENRVPVQILSCVSQEKQTAYETKLGEVGIFLSHNTPEMPAVVIIGENAKRIN